MTRYFFTKSNLIAFVVIVILITTTNIVKINRRYQIRNAEYNLAQVAQQLRIVRQKQRRLRIEHTLLRNPKRIERIAQNHGLNQAEPSQTHLIPRLSPLRSSK